MRRDRQAEPGEDRRGDVAEVGVEGPAGGDAGAGPGDDAFGAVGAGHLRVGFDPVGPGGELAADPVGLVGRGDQVGVAFAGGVDPVGLRGVDHLREEGDAGLGVAGLGEGGDRGGRASSTWRGVASGAPGRRSVEFR